MLEFLLILHQRQAVSGLSVVRLMDKGFCGLPDHRSHSCRIPPGWSYEGRSLFEEGQQAE